MRTRNYELAYFSVTRNVTACEFYKAPQMRMLCAIFQLSMSQNNCLATFMLQKSALEYFMLRFFLRLSLTPTKTRLARIILVTVSRELCILMGFGII